MSKAEGFSIGAYSQKELAFFYKCSGRTFRRWVQPFNRDIGPKIGKIYNPRQVKVIVERLGEPGV